MKGLIEKAIEVNEAARNRRSAIFGPKHPETLRTMHTQCVSSTVQLADMRSSSISYSAKSLSENTLLAKYKNWALPQNLWKRNEEGEEERREESLE